MHLGNHEYFKFFATSSDEEDGVFDVRYSTAHLLHPFSQL